MRNGGRQLQTPSYLIALSVVIASDNIRTTSDAVPLRPWIWGLLLIILALAAYSPATRCGFIWDDDDHITANPVIVGPLGLKEIWTTTHARICPLVQTVWLMEHKFWGLDPQPYHLVNILMHAAAALVLWRVLLQMKVPGAWLGAAIWMLHPVQVESAAWITEMKNTQCAFFFLLSILFYSKSRSQQAPSSWHYILTLLFGAMAIASKSAAMVLPLVLVLCGWWMDGRWRWRRSLIQMGPLFLLSALSGLMSVWSRNVEGSGEGQKWALDWLLRLPVAGKALWFYLGKLIWPQPLVMIYPRWELNAANPLIWLPAVAAALLTILLWRNRSGRSGRAFFMAWSCFVIGLLPVLGLLTHGFLKFSFVADHFQYLACVAPLALIGAGISQFLDRFNDQNPWIKPSLCALLLTTLGALTWRQCHIYQNEETLWTATLKNNPACWVGHNNLGAYIMSRPGHETRYDEAAAHYLKAIEIKPDCDRAFLNLGILLREKGQFNEAITALQKALDINPRLAQAHLNMALCYEQTGRMEDARSHFQKTVELNPDNAFARKKLEALKTR